MKKFLVLLAVVGALAFAAPAGAKGGDVRYPEGVVEPTFIQTGKVTVTGGFVPCLSGLTNLYAAGAHTGNGNQLWRFYYADSIAVLDQTLFVHHGVHLEPDSVATLEFAAATVACSTG